jgi:hypothetical protein
VGVGLRCTGVFWLKDKEACRGLGTTRPITRMRAMPKERCTSASDMGWGANLQVACANRNDDFCSGGPWGR